MYAFLRFYPLFMTFIYDTFLKVNHTTPQKWCLSKWQYHEYNRTDLVFPLMLSRPTKYTSINHVLSLFSFQASFSFYSISRHFCFFLNRLSGITRQNRTAWSKILDAFAYNQNIFTCKSHFIAVYNTGCSLFR